MKGTFITFEGGEGSGKSTQARLLAAHLKQGDREVIATREPGGTDIGDAIRAVLLDPDLTEMGNVTELLLLAASRAQNVHQRVRPGLERGAVVICDRFIDSTLAYQGYGRNFDLELLRALNRLATGGVTPDLTILLDLPVEVGLARAKALDKAESKDGQGDRIEQMDIEFHRRLRKGFLDLAAAEPERFRVIEVGESIEVTQEKVVSLVEDFIARRG